MAEKNSLWKNIRKKAEQNRRTGATPKKPTAEMLRQERKIKAKKYAEGGETDPPYRPLSIPMEGYEPDSVFYETPSRYSEPEPKPVNKKEDKLTSKRSEVQNYYLNQTLNQNSSTPKPDGYVAERDSSSTKLSPAMSTKEWQEGPRSFGPTLNDLDVVTDVMQLGNFVPHPLAQAIGKVGNWGGIAIDSYQAAEAYDKGNYSDMATNIASAGLGAYLGAKGRGYTRDMYNTVPGSVADKIANLGSRSGAYRPLTALPHLKNNAVIQRGLNYNRGILGGIGAETIYDSKAQGGYMYPDGGGINPGKQKAVASTTDVSVRALPEGLFEQVKANPPARQPEVINIVDKRKYNPVTKGPINPNRDLVTWSGPSNIVDETINSAYKHEVDPYIALAIGLQESRLGKTDPNIGHLLYSNEDYTPGVDEMVSFIKEKENYAKKLGYKDREHFIQAYNGLGKVFPETEQDYHGFKMKSIYGVPVPKEGINLAKNPLYGKKIINIADSVLKQNPQIVSRVQQYKPKMDGGAINPYMYYEGGPMQYEVGGKVIKNIGAGAYGILSGAIGAVTGGATNKFMDKGYNYLQKKASKNFDPNDPDDVKWAKSQDQFSGYGTAVGGIGAGILTGNVQGAIGQTATGLNKAFQASDWASDDFKKWSNIGSTAIGIGAGLAGGNLNSAQSASKIGQAATKFGSQASKISPYANQALELFGSNEQTLLQQGVARQEYLNSPEYLAMKERENQAYVNQGLSFAANGGPVNNNLLTLQTDSMRKNINSYRRKYKEGGQVDVNDKLAQFGLRKIQNGGRHWQNPKDGVIVGNASVEEDEVLKFAEGGSANLSNAEYVYPDTVNDEFTLPMYKPNESLTDFELDKDGNPIPLDMTPAEFLIKEGTKGSPFRKINTLAKIRMNNAEAITRKARDLGMAINEQNQQNQQMMVDGALQIAAAGGKLNKDLERILSDDIQSYIEADNYYAYGGYLPRDKGFNMPNSYAKGGSIHIKKSKRGTFTAAAKKRGKSVQEFAKDVLRNKGNYSAAMVKKANFARNAAGWKHAEGGNITPDNPGFNALPEYVQAKIMSNMAMGGPLYGNTDSEYTYSHGGPVVSNVNQGFDLYAQNRGGMMMAEGGMMQSSSDRLTPQEMAIMAKILSKSPDDYHMNQYNKLSDIEKAGVKAAYKSYTGSNFDDLSFENQFSEPYKNAKDSAAYLRGYNTGYETGAEFPKYSESTLKQGMTNDPLYRGNSDGYFNNPKVKKSQGGNMYAVGGPPDEDPNSLDYIINASNFMYSPEFENYWLSREKLPDGSNAKNRQGKWNDNFYKYGVAQDNFQPNEEVSDFDRTLGSLKNSEKITYLGKNPNGETCYLVDGYKVCGPQGEIRNMINNRYKTYQPQIVADIYQNTTGDFTPYNYENLPGISSSIASQINQPDYSGDQNFTDRQNTVRGMVSNAMTRNQPTPVQPIGGMQSRNLQQLPTDNTTPGIIGNVQQMPGLSDYASSSLGEFSEQFTPEDIEYGKYLDKNKPVPMTGPVVSEDVKLTPEETAALEYQQKYSQPGQFTGDLIDNQSNQTGFTNIYKNTPTTIVQPSQSDVTPTVFPQTGTSSTQTKQSNQPNQGLTGLDYASGIANLAAPLSQLYYGAKGPDPVNYERVTGEKIDPTVAIALAAEEGRRAQDSAAYLMRQSAPTSGSYMNNLRNLSLQSGKQRGALAGGLRYQADLSNTQMQNELNKVNAGISMQEQIARQQEQDAARTNVTEGLSGIGSSTANMIRDYRTNQINQMIAKNIGTNNYKYDPINQTITYRTQNGEMVTVPAQTVVGTNPVNIATGQMQQPKASYQSSTTTPKSNTPVVPYSGPMANYLNKNKLPEWKGYMFTDDFPVTGLDLNTGNYVENNPSVKNLDKTDTEGIKAFQDWMDEFYPNWLNNGKSLKKGKGYGNFGDQTENAWNIYGNTFLGAAPNKYQPPVNTLYDDPTLTYLFENI